VAKLRNSSFDVTRLSIIGKDCCIEERLLAIHDRLGHETLGPRDVFSVGRLRTRSGTIFRSVGDGLESAASWSYYSARSNEDLFKSRKNTLGRRIRGHIR
jgi:hypothetical protein